MNDLLTVSSTKHWITRSLCQESIRYLNFGLVGHCPTYLTSSECNEEIKNIPKSFVTSKYWSLAYI